MTNRADLLHRSSGCNAIVIFAAQNTINTGPRYYHTVGFRYWSLWDISSILILQVFACFIRQRHSWLMRTFSCWSLKVPFRPIWKKITIRIRPWTCDQAVTVLQDFDITPLIATIVLLICEAGIICCCLGCWALFVMQSCHVFRRNVQVRARRVQRVTVSSHPSLVTDQPPSVSTPQPRSSGTRRGEHRREEVIIWELTWRSWSRSCTALLFHRAVFPAWALLLLCDIKRAGKHIHARSFPLQNELSSTAPSTTGDHANPHSGQTARRNKSQRQLF